MYPPTHTYKLNFLDIFLYPRVIENKNLPAVNLFPINQIPTKNEKI